MRSFVIPSAFALVVAALVAPSSRAEVSGRIPLTLQVEQHADRLVITHDAQPVATYVFGDREILRPYFAHVHTPSGLPVTRNHPPRDGVDALDHATMHPGVWLAFGDLGGGDFWRNKGRVEHVEFVEPPQAKMDGKDGIVTFAAKQRYVIGDYAAGGKIVCYELARHTIRASRDGFLLTFDSEFSGDEPFAFGDQEEMGLGVRLATPIAVKGGSGTLTNSEGRTNEKEVWGRQADWCDYSGVLTTTIQPGDRERKLRSGLLVVPHPDNFRRSWMHARDYGVLVANPFGQRAFTKGDASRIELRPGEKLRLRFGVWSYGTDATEKPDLEAMAAEYVRLSKDR